MPCGHMAPLTKNRRLGDQHAFVRGAVRIVTRHAPIPARRMLPKERAPLVGMAGRAQLGNRVPFSQERSSFATLSRWQVTHSSGWVLAFNCPTVLFGSCTLWHVVHVRPRASCWLPSQSACS